VDGVTPEDDDGDDEPERLHVVIDAANAGDRIDAAIAALTGLSRAVVQRLIEDGHVSPAKKASHRVTMGDAFDIEVPAPEPIEVVPEDIPLEILFEDPDIIVIDKPAGLVVHPAAGHTHGTLVNALLFHCKDLSGIGGALRPGIVHRLDKDTTGVMVVAKSDRAHAALTAAFAAKSRGEGTLLREYLGITSPAPPKSGTLKTYYGRHPTDRKRFSSKVTTGKLAVTHWTVERALPDGALVRFRLETGRTHQIRVHAADHGWPLIGDSLYGKKSKRIARQALHAAVLELEHPATNARFRFESPLPPDMVAALE